MSQNCILRQGLFDRWFIFHPHNVTRAWSGSDWVSCGPDGLPHMVQVCNFDNEEQARDYCTHAGLVPQDDWMRKH